MTSLVGSQVLISEQGGRVDWSDNNLIAFSRIENLDVSGTEQLASEIWTMRPDGSHQVCLTAESDAIPHLSNDQPAWHPSSEYLLFQCADPDLPLPGIPPEDYFHFVQGGFGYNNNLWLMSSNGQRYWQLTKATMWDGILHPHFSPDGNKVFWSAYEHPRLGGHGWALMLADFTERRGTPQLENVQTLYPLGEPPGDQCYEAHAVSNSGRRLLYSYSAGMPLDLDIMQTNLEKDQHVNMTSSPGVWDEHAHWNPAGDTIAWISSRGFPFTPSENWQAQLRTEVWLMDADSSYKRQLTSFNDDAHVICADLAWSPAGDQIVLCRTESTARHGSRQQVLRLDLG